MTEVHHRLKNPKELTEMELAQPLIRVALSSPWEAYLLAAFPFSDRQARETCQEGSLGSFLESGQRLPRPQPHRTALQRQAAAPQTHPTAPGQLSHQSLPVPPGLAPHGPACLHLLRRLRLPANLPSPSLLLPHFPLWQKDLPREDPPTLFLCPLSLPRLTSPRSYQ